MVYKGSKEVDFRGSQALTEVLALHDHGNELFKLNI